MEIEELKLSISQILDKLNGELSSTAISEISHYLKYNEIKLSLEMMIDFIEEDDISITQVVFEDISNLCVKLNIEECYYSDLKVRL